AFHPQNKSSCQKSFMNPLRQIYHCLKKRYDEKICVFCCVDSMSHSLSALGTKFNDDSWADLRRNRNTPDWSEYLYIRHLNWHFNRPEWSVSIRDPCRHEITDLFLYWLRTSGDRSRKGYDDYPPARCNANQRDRCGSAKTNPTDHSRKNNNLPFHVTDNLIRKCLFGIEEYTGDHSKQRWHIVPEREVGC